MHENRINHFQKERALFWKTIVPEDTSFPLKRKENPFLFSVCHKTIAELIMSFQTRVNMKQSVKENGREQGLHVTNKD